MIYQTVPYSAILNDTNARFQCYTIIRYSISQKRYECRHSFNRILIGTYTRPTQQCYFEWPWVILSNLAKYSMTRSVARSICDSWATCLSTAVPESVYGVVTTDLPLNKICKTASGKWIHNLMYFIVVQVVIFVGKWRSSLTRLSAFFYNDEHVKKVKERIVLREIHLRTTRRNFYTGQAWLRCNSSQGSICGSTLRLLSVFCGQ